MREISFFDSSRIFSVDEIVKVLEKHQIPINVLQDDIDSEQKNIIPYSGKKNEKMSIKIKGKDYHRLGFSAEIIEEVKE